MKIRNFKKIYSLELNNEMSLEQEESFLFCGSKNWDFYFSNRLENSNVVDNVSIIEFNSNEEFTSFIKSTDILDYSLEHQRPLVLVESKNMTI
ncbi:MAG: hypothetical protein GX170_08295 [Campylobacteraceae bacterium]|jgi:hypothetical protein|nr:hypothetical protein [Campylobacteraceae bacterium]